MAKHKIALIPGDGIGKEVLPEGVAFLIVGAVYAVAAAVLVPKGKDRLSRVRPVPEKTSETVREEVRWAREQLS